MIELSSKTGRGDRFLPELVSPACAGSTHSVDSGNRLGDLLTNIEIFFEVRQTLSSMENALFGASRMTTSEGVAESVGIALAGVFQGVDSLRNVLQACGGPTGQDGMHGCFNLVFPADAPIWSKVRLALELRRCLSTIPNKIHPRFSSARHSASSLRRSIRS